ncbi:unnamed protein product [Orchesella dallaii]|uniref:Uncharacterized protein n=1 Tax=Orchesella dallaii TaxID=48710 RepID=A0ABP1S0I4_9HEXA
MANKHTCESSDEETTTSGKPFDSQDIDSNSEATENGGGRRSAILDLDFILGEYRDVPVFETLDPKRMLLAVIVEFGSHITSNWRTLAKSSNSTVYKHYFCIKPPRADPEYIEMKNNIKKDRFSSLISDKMWGYISVKKRQNVTYALLVKLLECRSEPGDGPDIVLGSEAYEKALCVLDGPNREMWRQVLVLPQHPLLLRDFKRARFEVNENALQYALEEPENVNAAKLESSAIAADVFPTSSSLLGLKCRKLSKELEDVKRSLVFHKEAVERDEASIKKLEAEMLEVEHERARAESERLRTVTKELFGRGPWGTFQLSEFTDALKYAMDLQDDADRKNAARNVQKILRSAIESHSQVRKRKGVDEQFSDSDELSPPSPKNSRQSSKSSATLDNVKKRCTELFYASGTNISPPCTSKAVAHKIQEKAAGKCMDAEQIEENDFHLVSPDNEDNDFDYSTAPTD